MKSFIWNSLFRSNPLAWIQTLRQARDQRRAQGLFREKVLWPKPVVRELDTLKIEIIEPNIHKFIKWLSKDEPLPFDRSEVINCIKREILTAGDRMVLNIKIVDLAATEKWLVMASLKGLGEIAEIKILTAPKDYNVQS